MSWVECESEADIEIAYRHLKEIENWTSIRNISWFNEGWCLNVLGTWQDLKARKTLKIFYAKDDKGEAIGSFLFKFIEQWGENGRWFCLGTNFDDMPYEEADALIYPFWKSEIEKTGQTFVFADSWIENQLVAPERTDLIERMASYGIKIDVIYNPATPNINPHEVVRLI